MPRTAVLLAAAVLLVVPLAGCVGGSGDGGGLFGGGGAPTNNSSATNASAPDGGESVEAGDRPHVHPRWDDPATDGYDSLERVVLVDRNFTLDPTRQDCPHTADESDSPILPVCLGGVEFGPGNWSDGTPHIVPPGTANVTVQVSWSSSARIAGVNAFYRHSQNRPGTWQGQIPGGPIEESGGTVTVPIESKNRTEWPDNGHAEESAWRFAVEAWGNPAGAANNGVRVARGAIRVRVVADRVEGELPIEPAHPDYWQNTSTYQVGYLNGSTNATVVAGPFTVDRGSGDPQTTRPGVKWINSPGKLGYRFNGVPPETITRIPVEHAMSAVPPRSKLLFAAVHVEVSSQANAPQVCALVSDEPANRWRTAQPIEDCKAAPSGGGTVTFSKELKQTDWDSLYAGAENAKVSSRYTFFTYIRPQKVHESLATPSAFQVDDLDVGIFVTQNTEAEVPGWAMGPSP